MHGIDSTLGTGIDTGVSTFKELQAQAASYAHPAPIATHKGANRAERRAAEKAKRRRGWGSVPRSTNKPFEYREMV